MLEIESWPLAKRLYYYQHLAALREHDSEQMDENMPETPDVESGEYGMTQSDELPGMNANSPDDPDENDPIDMDSVHPDLHKYDSIVTTGDSE